jgi:hypothetical protein
MPSNAVNYRLRIRNDANTADIVVVTMSGADAHIIEPPSIDGATFDPLTGKTTYGQANVLVADPVVSTGRRFITQHLGDASGNSQLIGRRAFIEISRDGSGFAAYFSGYLSAIRTVDAIHYEITVSHTTREEETTKAFGTTEYPNLTARSYLFGGPVSVDVPSSHPSAVVQKAQGFWQARVAGVYSTYVHLDINEDTSLAFPPQDIKDRLRSKTGIRLNNNDFQKNVFNWARTNAQKYFVKGYPSDTAKAQWENPPSRPTNGGEILGYMPRVQVQFLTRNGNMINYGAPMMGSYSFARVFENSVFGYFEAPVFEDLGNHFYVAWPSGGAVPQPSVNDVLTFYAIALDVSEASPVWIVDHPVYIIRDLLTYFGQTVETAGISDAVARVGNIKAALRVTEPRTIAETLEYLCGTFGLGVRTNQSGTRSIFAWRSRAATAPTVTINDLADTTGVWWSTDEGSRLFSVRWELQRYQTWPGDAKRKNIDEQATGDRALDGVVAESQEISFQVSDEKPAQSREQSYELPGTLLSSTGAALASIVDTLAVWADQMLAVYEFGAVTTEINVLHTVTLDIGDECVLQIEPRPGIFSGQTPTAQRNTPERCLVIGRTPAPWGSTLRLLRVAEVGPAPDGNGSSGPTVPSLSTAFTLALGSEPSRLITVTMTNTAGWINTASAQIEYAQQDAVPTDGDARQTASPLWSPVTTPYTLGPLTGGRTVWVRLRAVLSNTNESLAWSSWQTITLDPAVGGGGVLQTPSVDWVLDTGTGKVSVTLQAGDEAAKAYLLTSLSVFPTVANTLLQTPDTLAPFAWPDVATITNSQALYITAVTEDIDGNYSLPGYAVARFPAAGGTPGVMGLPGLSGARLAPRARLERLVSWASLV